MTSRQQSMRTLLLVEDNPGDIRLMEEVLRPMPFEIRLITVDNGHAALDYLNRRHPYERASHPEVILLDWHLPQINGQQVLTAIRNDPKLRSIPVIVVSGSSGPEDIDIMYELQVVSYVPKPVSPEPFVRLLGGLMFFRCGVEQVRSREA